MRVGAIHTIGHSTRTLEEFIALLKSHAITLVADVRTIPRSRRNAHFNSDSLPVSLATENIGYEHFSELGGLRRPRADSPNTGWRNASFRGYADHMRTDAFRDGMQKLTTAAAQHRVAVMCAEAVPWRCHRSLIADALLARGSDVRHIMSATTANRHKLTPFAVVEGLSIVYPQPALSLPAKDGALS